MEGSCLDDRLFHFLMLLFLEQNPCWCLLVLIGNLWLRCSKTESVLGKDFSFCPQSCHFCNSKFIGVVIHFQIEMLSLSILMLYISIVKINTEIIYEIQIFFIDDIWQFWAYGCRSVTYWKSDVLPCAFCFKTKEY